MSYKCQEKMYDNDNFNLQLKNMLRFEFDAHKNVAKAQVNEKKDVGRIEGWKAEHENGRPSVMYLY